MRVKFINNLIYDVRGAEGLYQNLELFRKEEKMTVSWDKKPEVVAIVIFYWTKYS